MERLSPKKSFRKLSRILAVETLVIFVFLMVAMMNSAKAQQVEQVDFNSFRVTETSGNFYHVNAEGIYSGPFKLQQTYDNGKTLTIVGSMSNGKKIGKEVYRLDNEIVAIRHYDANGLLVKSVRIRQASEIDRFRELAQN